MKKSIYSLIALTTVFIFLLSSSITPAMAQPAGGDGPSGECLGPQCEVANDNYYKTLWRLFAPNVCCGKWTPDDMGSQDIAYQCSPDNPCEEETCPICNPEQH